LGVTHGLGAVVGDQELGAKGHGRRAHAPQWNGAHLHLRRPRPDFGRGGKATREVRNDHSITNNDIVAFNANPTNNPVDTASVFAKMWDPEGMVGWKITGPGHGFTLVNINDWQGAVASAPLSHLGFHAPLLLTEGPTQLPSAVDGYLSSGGADVPDLTRRWAVQHDLCNR